MNTQENVESSFFYFHFYTFLWIQICGFHLFPVEVDRDQLFVFISILFFATTSSFPQKKRRIKSFLEKVLRPLCCVATSHVFLMHLYKHSKSLSSPEWKQTFLVLSQACPGRKAIQNALSSRTGMLMAFHPALCGTEEDAFYVRENIYLQSTRSRRR